VAFGGFVYVIGGTCRSGVLDSVEIYNPKTNSWSMKTISISHQIYGAVVVNRPPHLQTN
jgi:kelch-like protein 2/3